MDMIKLMEKETKERIQYFAIQAPRVCDDHFVRQGWPDEAYELIDNALCEDKDLEKASHDFFSDKGFFPVYLIQHKMNEAYRKSPYPWREAPTELIPKAKLPEGRYHLATENKFFGEVLKGHSDWQKDAVYQNLRTGERVWVVGVEVDYLTVVRGVQGTASGLVYPTDKFIKVQDAHH